MDTIRKYTILLILLLLSVGYILIQSCKYFEPPPKKISKVEDVFFNQKWATVVANVNPIEGIEGWKASDCGKCHQDIYEEWKHSTHANALHDLQFQSELAKPTSPAWLCLNCHIPMQNQREYILIGLEDGDFRKPVTIPNLEFIPELREEGVTCGTCHIRNIENGKSVIIGANGNYSPPHPVVKDPDSLRNRCWDCHNAEYILDRDLICYFQTGKEMLDAYKNKIPSNFNCHSCHMPTIYRSIVKPELKKPIRKSHKHSFWGGGIPKTFELYNYLEASGFNPALEILGIKKHSINTISLRLKNSNQAHKLPSGDPERFIFIEIHFHDINNIIQDTITLKIGQDWEWWPEAKLKNDNRFLPNEEREIILTTKMDNLNELSYLDIKVFYVRLTEENLNYMKENYHQVNPKYKEKIKNMEKYYPTKTQIFKILWSPQKGFIEKKSWKELIPKNE